MKQTITFRSVVAFCAMTLMLLFNTGTANAQTPYVIWIKADSTLYFTYTTDVLADGDTYNGQTITKVFSGDAVVNSGTSNPQWITNTKVAKKVVFDASFSSVRPTSTYGWFSGFTGLKSIEGISNLNTSDVTNMSYMFYNCTALQSIDASSFDTRNVTNMSYMFYNCDALQSIDASSFDTGNVTDMSQMFRACDKVQSIDVSSFDTGNVTNMAFMFSACPMLQSIDVSSFDTGNVTNMRAMFGATNYAKGCYSLTTIDVSNFNISKVTNISCMFRNCGNLQSIIGLDGWDTSNVENMQSLFFGCVKLTKADVSNFNTSKVTDMSEMFQLCKVLPTINVSGFNTSNVTNMYAMFSWCQRVAVLDVSNFNTSKVTNMAAMFSNCGQVNTLDVSNFDTSKVTNMGIMFEFCSRLQSIDVSNFDTSKVTSMSMMFAGCSSLKTLDLANFNTSRVTNIGGMFNGCSGLEVLNIRNFDVSNVTYFEGTRTYPDPISTPGVLSGFYLFNNVGPTIICDNDWRSNTSSSASSLFGTYNPVLVGEYGFKYINTNKSIAYAHPNEEGYFTLYEETLTANAADGFYWATYYNVRVGSIADENTTVYKAVLDQENKVVNLTEIPDKIIKKGQAVILKSTSPTITLTRKTEVINGGTGNFSGNSLTGFDHNVYVNAYDQPTDMGTLYTLGKVDGVLGFYKIKNGIQLKARKAYLAIPNGNEAGYRFDFDANTATAIDNIISDDSSENMNGVFYNLSGQRLDNPTRGVYIVNGKKVIIK